MLRLAICGAWIKNELKNTKLTCCRSAHSTAQEEEALQEEARPVLEVPVVFCGEDAAGLKTFGKAEEQASLRRSAGKFVQAGWHCCVPAVQKPENLHCQPQQLTDPQKFRIRKTHEGSIGPPRP